MQWYCKVLIVSTALGLKENAFFREPDVGKPKLVYIQSLGQFSWT